MRTVQDRARGPERTEREARDENVPAKRADFFIIKAKSSPFTSVSVFFSVSQILKTKFYAFWAQTCRNQTKLLK